MAGMKSGKPSLGIGAPKAPPTAKFALGTRPASLRGKPALEPKMPKAPNTRDYGTKTPPATAIQPGNPMPGNQTGI